VLSSKYRLSRLLGEGGMGAVYEATHEVLGTRVAVKVLHQDLARRSGLIERFLQEAMVAARIQSENVVHVMDVERSSEGYAFMVMELLQGEPLSGVLDRARRLDEKTSCDYARQILLALEAAHALGVVHRDLKPENVFVTYAGQRPVLKLIDFGIAKLKRTEAGAKNLTVAGVLMGTPEYMAPEQAYSADAVDVRADLYAVGVMLYEMLAGSRPVSGEDGRIIALKVERGEITPLVRALPSVKPEIAGLVHRAMAFRRELRFGSATEMRLALEAAQAARTGQIPERAPEVAGKVSTGTMMGAPIAALASTQRPAIDPRLAEVPAGSGTVVAPAGSAPEPAAAAGSYGPPPAGAYGPPAASAYGAPPVGAPPHAPAMVPSAPHVVPQKRSSFPLVPVLIAGSLLLGAAIAGALVVSSQSDTPTPVPVPVPPLPTTPAATAPDPHPTTLPNTPPLTPTLTPQPAQPTPAQPGPTTRPSTSPTAPPSGTGTVAPAPSLPFPQIPSSLPTFTVPTGWPSVPVIPGFPVPPSPVAPTSNPSSGY